VAQTQINGGTQIASATITQTQLNVATPTTSGQVATKGYVDGVAAGLNAKLSAVAATTGAETTITIASGSVTTISGTTLDGQSPAVNDYVLIKDAPAATGAGSAGSTQPGNGLYQVTNATTNLTVARATDMSGTNLPQGAYCYVEGGTANAASGWVVSTPSTTGAFTYGTNNIKWTQFSGAGEITVDSTLTKTGNQLSRPALTGDVTASTGSNATTIAAAAVTLAKQANLAANSVIGNSTGSSATPTAVGMATGATASTVALRDANAALTALAFIGSVATTATAAGTTTLTVASAMLQQFTGSTTQTVVMPSGTTLVNGQEYYITNRSTGVVTVNANGGGLLQTMAAGSQLILTLISNGTTAGTWDVGYLSAGGTGTVTSASVVTANGFQGTVATSTSTPAITIQTSLAAGVLASNGSNAMVAATTAQLAGGYVVREAVGGTVNSSNTAFTLVNTPVSGTEMIFQRGLLLTAGGSNDYTISGSSITFINAPQTGDTLFATYWH
jgi:hypothetical protein